MAVGRLSLRQFPTLNTSVTLLVAFNTGLQIVITALIAIKLLDPRDIKLLPQTQRSMRFRLVRCLVESGLIITVALILDLALFVQHVSFHWVFNISLTQLYAINTVLIVLRMNDIAIAPHPRSHSAPSHSSAGIISHQSENYVPPHAPRMPVDVALFSEPRPSDLNGEPKLPSGSTRDPVEMNWYDTERGEGKNPAGMYVHIRREVHNDVSV